MGAGLRAGAAARDRAADGLDQFGRHETTGAAAFDSKDEAIAYCERDGIAYEVFESKPPKRQRIAYSDNFAPTRRGAWTH